MSQVTYNWKRYWHLRGTSIRLEDGGYLSDPDALYGHILNPNAVSLASMINTRCLILLAEPGMGKTRTMEMWQREIEPDVKAQGAENLYFNLRSYSSEDRLIRNLFDHSTVKTWAVGTHRLHLFLDSLDEGLLGINTLAALLGDELSRYPVDRLSLRIACRTAEWPLGLEHRLRELWGKDAVDVYELAPLRRVDVAEAARTKQIDADDFLTQIAQMNVVPLAIKPVTLDLLLNTYQRDGQLPTTQADLYHKGCRLLCEEVSSSRRDAGRMGVFTPDQRLAAAGRIAAVTIFSNRNAVWVSADRGDVPSDDVTLYDFTIETERADPLGGDQQVLNEVLATGLFSSRGPNRLGWAHQTYAEFLAAWFVNQQRLSLTQLLSLLEHPDDRERKLVPQLHETSAWLAGMRHDVFHRIMTTDPEVLLRSDIATATDQDREMLVTRLLTLYEDEQLIDQYPGTYHKLNHPRLADQLRPYIGDRSKRQATREVAVMMAAACKLRVVQDDLVQVVLDPTEDLSIRVDAVIALDTIGDPIDKSSLRPLVFGHTGDDPDDTLKGLALRAVWPGHLTATELFSVLSIPSKPRSLGSSYDVFLVSNWTDHIQIADLPTALEWIAHLPSRFDLPAVFRQPINAIFLKSWTNLEAPGVLTSFARAALSRLDHHEPIIEKLSDGVNYAAAFGGGYSDSFQAVLNEHDHRRRQLAEVMLPLLDDDRDGWVKLIASGTKVIIPRDVPWLIEQFEATTSVERQATIAHVMKRLFRWHQQELFEVVLNAYQNKPSLKPIFDEYFRPILDSAEAKEQRADHEIDEERRARLNQRPAIDPPPHERVARWLHAFEAGDLDAWWKLNIDLTLASDGSASSEAIMDITALPGWHAADEATQTRIIDAAHLYVLKADPKTALWLGEDINYQPARAGYCALHLLAQQAPNLLGEIPPQVWLQWTPTILSIFGVPSGRVDDVHTELIRLAHYHAPDVVVEGIAQDLDRQVAAGGAIAIAPSIRTIWNERIADLLLSKARDVAVSSVSLHHLLKELLNRQAVGAQAFAETLLSRPLPVDEVAREKAIVAASALILHTENASWSVVWPLMQQDVPFGRAVVERIASQGYRFNDSLGKKFSEQELADFYIWLAQQYPYAEDPQHPSGEMYTITARDSVASWRGGVLRNLEERGTPQSCTEIQRIMQSFPELDWLRWTLLRTQALTRRRTWVAPIPEYVLRVLFEKQSRLVQSGDQLLTVLLESLERLEDKLQDETPAAIDLWNEIPMEGRKQKYTYRPKDENRLSDYIKRHLDEDLRRRGVVVNREVEIRRGEGGNPGERTDIQVDATTRTREDGSYDVLTVIIEVKGQWHSEVRDAMQTQLVERYLKDNYCQYGLYLVGWFMCDQWIDESRRKQALRLGVDKDDIQYQLENQAESLSQKGVRVRAKVLDVRLR